MCQQSRRYAAPSCVRDRLLSPEPRPLCGHCSGLTLRLAATRLLGATRHSRMAVMLASLFFYAFVMARHPPTCGVCRRMAPSSRVAASLNVSLRQRPRSGRSLRSPRASSPASSRIAAALTHNTFVCHQTYANICAPAWHMLNLCMASTFSQIYPSACHASLTLLSCIRGCAVSFYLWRCSCDFFCAYPFNT